MLFHRNIEEYLQSWKNKEKRKPLLVRGARQVGKTFSILQFGKEAFEHVAYVNLENPEHIRHFRNPLSLQEFLAVIRLQFNIPVVPGRTLVFIDEIQNSPQVVKLLRFFYEDMPALHVIAAGSLLEVFIANGGFEIPVGRVEYLYLYPMDLYEFAAALGSAPLVEHLRTLIPGRGLLPAALHEEALRIFQKYLLFGGMPEAVGAVARRAFDELPRIYNSLLTAYTEDTAKYAGRARTEHLSFIIDHAPLFAGRTVTYEHFDGSQYRSREIAKGFQLLAHAMLLTSIGGTTSLELPLREKPKRAKKIIFLDTGLVSYRMRVPHEEIVWDRLSGALKGNLFEQVVGQMLLARGVHERAPLYYWTRERTPTEVDFCFAHGYAMVGVEVKAGGSGHLKSLMSFAQHVRGNRLVRVSPAPLAVETLHAGGSAYHVLNVPFYLVPRMHDLLDVYE